MVKSAQDEYRELYHREAKRLIAAGMSIAALAAKGGSIAQGTADFAVVVSQGMIVADLLGRRRTILEAKAAAGVVTAPATIDEITEVATTIANVPYNYAIEEIERRTPELAQTASEVAAVYQEGSGFAIAKSASTKITQRVMDEFKKSFVEGYSAEAIIQKVGNWTRAYTETVYRTNLNTAYTAGRFKQAMDPDVREVIGALEFNAVGDSDTRQGRPRDHGENHLAADGFTASPDDPNWDRVSPPCGYNCRCTLRMVPWLELKAGGHVTKQGTVEPIIPSNFNAFSPHPAFAQSPFRRIYG